MKWRNAYILACWDCWSESFESFSFAKYDVVVDGSLSIDLLLSICNHFFAA